MARSLYKELQRIKTLGQSWSGTGWALNHLSEYVGEEMAEQLAGRLLTPVLGPTAAGAVGRRMVADARKVWA